jgi:hypothetical protein
MSVICPVFVSYQLALQSSSVQRRWRRCTNILLLVSSHSQLRKYINLKRKSNCVLLLYPRTWKVFLSPVNIRMIETSNKCWMRWLPLKPIIPYVPPGLTLQNFTFCPHSVWVFTCSVWISELTTIIPLYSINWLVFITENEVRLLRRMNWVFERNSG